MKEMPRKKTIFFFYWNMQFFLSSEYYAPRDRCEGWGFDRTILQNNICLIALTKFPHHSTDMLVEMHTH